jgi:lipopolysaccharide/colanic/teichoic acid biosynthesis glycosyltransferase
VGERVFALALLFLSAPLIAVIAVAIRLSAGSPVFHRGTRLGRDRRPFRMLKLRTLLVGAERITCGELVSQRHDLTIRGGRFLRDTRLDELPQLWNIVVGDMSFLGPRPERPEVLEAKCLGIPGYERRFSVRPGLIGISQLFTPHGTPKRYRTLLDNGLIRREAGAMQRLGIVAFTMWAVSCEIYRRGMRQLALLVARATRRFREKRRQHRVALRGATAQLGRPGFSIGARLVDMNEQCLLVECTYEPVLEQATELALQIPVPGKARPARRFAHCTGRVMERRIHSSSVHLVFQYEPCSPRSEYMIHQYFLRDSLAVPRRAWSGPQPVLPRVVPLPPAPLPAPQPAGPARHRHLRGVYHS